MRQDRDRFELDTPRDNRSFSARYRWEQAARQRERIEHNRKHPEDQQPAPSSAPLTPERTRRLIQQARISAQPQPSGQDTNPSARRKKKKKKG